MTSVCLLLPFRHTICAGKKKTTIWKGHYYVSKIRYATLLGLKISRADRKIVNNFVIQAEGTMSQDNKDALKISDLKLKLQ